MAVLALSASAGGKGRGLWTPGGDRNFGRQKSRLQSNPCWDSRGRQQFRKN